jgi:hypothetical protein
MLDATVFVARIKDNIQFLATMLASPREVTGLSTNCQKYLVSLIKCDSIDVNGIIQAF